MTERVIKSEEVTTWSRLRTWLSSGTGTALVLVLILLVAGYLRLSHINWDQETHIHPDERFLTMVADALRLPKSLGEYLNSDASPLNPYNVKDGSGNMRFPLYVYGNLPMTIVRVVAEAANKLNQAAHLWLPQDGKDPIDLTAYWGIHYVGRVVSGLFDLGGVLLIFFIAKRLYGGRTGLLAAAFVAFAVLPLQQSHFFTADTFATFFSLVTFYFAIRVAFGGDAPENDADGTTGPRAVRLRRSGGWLSYLALGLSLGATLACRINLAPEAGIALLAIGMRAWREWRLGYAENRALGRSETGWVPLLAQATLFRLVLFLVAAIMSFRIFMPYAFAGTSVLNFSFSQHWRDNMHEIQQLIGGEVDYPPGHQWTGRTPFVFPFVNMVVWGMGLPLGLAGWAGFLLAFYQIARSLTNRFYVPIARRHLLPVAWAGGMFLWQGLQYVQSMRYLLPIYPIVGMFAAWLLWWLVDRSKELWESTHAAGGPSAVPSGGGLRGRFVAAVAHMRRPWLTGAAYALLAIVTVGTMLWGWGFLAIYRRPLTRVTASRWIYDNVPAGSHIANEHWDDGLPLSIDGRCGFAPCGPYQGLSSSSDGQMQMYAEDTPEKREMLYRWLDEADYIVLSSNRLYGSIPRLPTRYPMTTEYYKLLFEGKLGFKQVLTVTSFPTIFGIQFPDIGAEEAFSVYDHPVVYVFKKTPDYSEARIRDYFGGIDLENTIQLWPKQASRAPTALLMTALEAARQRAGGTWTAIFNLNSLSNRLPVLVWLLLLEILGLAAFPILFVVMRSLNDRGYAFAKTFGILALAWLSWIGPSLKVLPYTRGLIAAMLALLVVIAGILSWRNWPAIRAFWRSRRSLLLTEEVLFLVLFGLFLFVRWGNPDLWHPARGGEKPMDLAYLNAVIRSTTFPPYDPWFAGGFINYYYFGFVMIGSLIKLTGIVPWAAYNLAVPTLFALTGLGAFGVAYNLAEGDPARPAEESPMPGMGPQGPGSPGRTPPVPVRPSALLAGLAGTVFVAIIGNFGEVKLVLDQWAQHSPVAFRSTIPGFAGLVQTLAGAVSWLTRTGPGQLAMQFPNDWWFWNASRVIPDTINEFPFFTFTYADLHAHMIAFPLCLLGLGAAVALVRLADFRVPGHEPDLWRIALPQLWVLLLLGFVIGALRATNTWDFPTYLLVALAAVVVLEVARRAGWHATAPVVLSGQRERVPQPARLALATASASGSGDTLMWAPPSEGGVSAATGGRQADPASLPTNGGHAPGGSRAGNGVGTTQTEGAPEDLDEMAGPEDAGEPELSSDTSSAALREVVVAPPVEPSNVLAEDGMAVGVAESQLSPWQQTLAFLARSAVSVIWRMLVVLAVAAIAVYPYTRYYATAYTGLQPWRDATTSVPDYLIVHGFFLAVIAIYLISEAVVQARAGLDDWFYDGLPFILAAVVLIAGAGWVLHALTWLIATPLLAAALVLAAGRGLPPARRLALLFIALGLAITMGVEVVRLQDDIGRMNTVFKFYLQAWVLFGVSAAFGLASWADRSTEWTPGWRRLAQVVTVVLFAGVMLYPPMAARAKVADRFSAEDQPRGLDGMAYMDQAQYFDNNMDLHLAADKAAILWMLQNVQGSPVILEGNTPNYRWGGRFSIYTGLPSVMGWDWHEKQQRSIVPGTVIDRRLGQVHELYASADPARMRQLLDLYNVKYIIVGQLERAFYGEQVDSRFDSLVQDGYLRVAYDKDGVRIFEVAGRT